MRKREKKLLIKYLTMALPYEVRCLGSFETVTVGPSILSGLDLGRDMVSLQGPPLRLHISEIKPYVRSLNEMTLREKKRLGKLGIVVKNGGKIKASPEGFCWLLQKKFDIFNLLDSGLAIKVSENFYPDIS